METNMKGDIDENYKERISFAEVANTFQSYFSSFFLSHLPQIVINMN